MVMSETQEPCCDKENREISELRKSVAMKIWKIGMIEKHRRAKELGAECGAVSCLPTLCVSPGRLRIG